MVGFAWRAGLRLLVLVPLIKGPVAVTDDLVAVTDFALLL